VEKTADSEIKRFARLKESVKEKIHTDLTKIESQTGNSIPKKVLQLFDDGVDEITPTTEEEFFELIKGYPEYIKSYLQSFKDESEGIDTNCKDFIDKMIFDLFKVTKGKGIENRIWLHFSKIWYYYQVVDQMKQTKISEDTLEKDIFTFSFLFVSFYEMTLQILTEFSLAIAIKKKTYNRRSQQFFNQYSKERARGRTITKHELVNFLTGEHYLSRDSCNILKNEKFRNKPAHADAYFDSDNKKMIIGEETFEVDEFRNLFTELNQFYCYLLYVYLKQPALLSMIEQLEEIAKKIPETPETKADPNKVDAHHEEYSSN